MIKPYPDNDLSLNILVLGSEIIHSLKSPNRSYVVVEEVLSDFLKKDSKRTPKHFMDAITFLYATGLLEYRGYKVRLRRSDDYTQLHLL